MEKNTVYCVSVAESLKNHWRFYRFTDKGIKKKKTEYDSVIS
jgi:hypothetical protein